MNDVNLTAERRHDIRYDVQQYFIPEMVECVKDGYLPFIALFPSAQWYSNLRMDYDIEELKAAKVWESFEKIEIDEDNMIILYTFPQPEEVPEALYGAVLLNQSTNDSKYFTLEASYEDKWAVCSKDTSMHSCLDFWDSADKDKFIQWVMGRLHR
jgi:hypothetical protein